MYLSRTVLKIRFDYLTGFPYFSRSSASSPSRPSFLPCLARSCVRLAISSAKRATNVFAFAPASLFLRPYLPMSSTRGWPLTSVANDSYTLLASFLMELAPVQITGYLAGADTSNFLNVARPFRPFPSSLLAHGSRREPAIPPSDVSRHRDTV